MKAYRNLREWLESQGSPLHFTAGGGDGSMTVAAADTSRFNPGITVYSYRETELPGGGTSFWMSSGWGIRKEWLPAIKGLLDDAAFLGIGGPALNRPEPVNDIEYALQGAVKKRQGAGNGIQNTRWKD